MTQDLVAARKVCLRAIQRVLTRHGLTEPRIAEKLLSALLEDEKVAEALSVIVQSKR